MTASDEAFLFVLGPCAAFAFADANCAAIFEYSDTSWAIRSHRRKENELTENQASLLEFP